MDGSSNASARAPTGKFGHVNNETSPPLDSPWGSFGRLWTLGVVSAFSKFVVQVMNRATCSNYDTLHKAMTLRDRPRGLITVSNHASTFDDPGLLSYLIPLRYFWTEGYHHGIRWTMCTKEICAATPLVQMFFAAGKTVPITRGGGIDQPVMMTMAERVSKGDWLHIFPEGRVSTDGELGRLKWGLGKMLCDVEEMGGQAPVVLPFWHSGMEKVKPFGVFMMFPGNHVHVTVGEPIEFGDLVARCKKCAGNSAQREELFKSMVARVEESMRETRTRNLKERDVM